MKLFMPALLLACCSLNPVIVNAMTLTEACASQLFLSELEAVRAAVDRYNPLSIRENREYMGAIFEMRGKFGYTVAAASPRRDQWQLKIPGVEWDRLRAFWHTHGDDSPEHRYFSDTDTDSVTNFGLPFYLADYTGYLKVFRSGGRTLSPFAAERLSLPRQSGFAIGDFVRDTRNRVVRVKIRDRAREQQQRS